MSKIDEAVEATLDAITALSTWINENHENYSSTVIREKAEAANQLAEAQGWIRAPRRTSSN